MPPRKKQKTKTNASNVDADPLFEELPPDVGANVVAAVTQFSQETAVDESPRRLSPRRSKASTTAPSSSNNHDDGGAEGQEEEEARRRSPRRSKTSTTAPSSSNNHDDGGAEGQEEEAATAPSSSNNHDEGGAERKEEEAEAGTTKSTVEARTELPRLFFGNALYAEAYANNPSEAYNQFFLQLYPRLSRFELPTTQYATTGLHETDFPLENDAFDAMNHATLIPALSELQRDPYFYLNAIPLFMAGPSSGHHQQAKDLSRLLGLSQNQIDLIINSVDWSKFNFCVRIYSLYFFYPDYWLTGSLTLFFTS